MVEFALIHSSVCLSQSSAEKCVYGARCLGIFNTELFVFAKSEEGGEGGSSLHHFHDVFNREIVYPSESGSRIITF